jgi:hypothetical protein
LVLLGTFPRASRAAQLEVQGPAGAAILVDREPAGTLPLERPLQVAPGTHTVRITMAGYHSQVHRIEAGGDEQMVRVEATLEPKSPGGAVLRSLLLPGLGQRYEDHPRLGWTLVAAHLGGLAAALGGEIWFQMEEDDFDAARARYERALTPGDAAAVQREVENAHDAMGGAETLRNAGIGVVAAAVVLAVADAWWRFPAAGAAGAGPSPSSHAAVRDQVRLTLSNTPLTSIAVAVRF